MPNPSCRKKLDSWRTSPPFRYAQCNRTRNLEGRQVFYLPQTEPISLKFYLKKIGRFSRATVCLWLEFGISSASKEDAVNELIEQLKSRVNLDDEKARAAAQVAMEFLKKRLPEP